MNDRKIKDGDSVIETDEQYIKRISDETREKILKSQKKVDIDSLLLSMTVEEPSHLGMLSQKKNKED